MMRGLNVGAGQRPFSNVPEVIEWANVDKVWHKGMPEPDLICDGAHLPYGGSQADYFVLHHVLEHFGCGEAAGLIEEAWRVLKPGGSLLVFVPDLRALAKGWLEGKISTQIYTTCLMGAYIGHEEDRHRWNFDENSLRECLSSSAPWKTIKRFDWRDISGLDAARDWWILDMEATK